jgi:hypothetical protein
MASQGSHISDQDLLMASDGEQSAQRMAQIRTHLVSCWVCRTRSSEIDNAIHDFVRTYHHEIDGSLPSAHGLRSLLKVRLGELAAKPRAQEERIFWSPLLRRFAYASAVLVSAVLIAISVQQRAMLSGPRFVPDPRLTPGATRLVSRDDICSDSTPNREHFIPSSLAKRVFEEYGVADPRPFAYEVDYLITPELGGADDIRNVWPEAYSGSEWNAHIKDALEERLHQMVCAGEMELAAAQQDIAHDWVAAYKKHFHTDHPLKEHLAYLKDRPWE